MVDFVGCPGIQRLRGHPVMTNDNECKCFVSRLAKKLAYDVV